MFINASKRGIEDRPYEGMNDDDDNDDDDDHHRPYNLHKEQ